MLLSCHHPIMALKAASICAHHTNRGGVVLSNLLMLPSECVCFEKLCMSASATGPPDNSGHSVRRDVY